ncbi:hypothetical protein ABIE88_001648 [Bradyrhizobium diazoefficiens]|uniref:Uncharacterized protein n=2 Tax=Nitrobacteraceae TaxID=41294 RepID=A0A837C6E8_9BRAD|nr:hypothetical protein BD122_01470 [Bradyrhizobium diazoefficiens]KGJ64722.1 hypothetical protein BJA5080_07422 [Bradyrhizobium diazoefficiens SEMIA 5080]MDA9395021.1 hypothetical protein [Bradyrhizobium sp. CCBAU 45394]
MMRFAFAAVMALLLGISPGQAQIATTGSTAMDLPTVPGAIVISPLNSPGPFSATTVPGAPDTTLAPVPLASDPTTPGTVVVCAPPATSPTPLPATPTVSSTGLSTSGIAAPILPVSGLNGSSIGTISTAAPAGTGATVACSSTPGGQVTSAASLPLSIPQVPASPAPGTILADTSGAGGTGIDPNAAVVPSPNSSACAEGVSMNLAQPATVLPANASGAAPTPGVSPILPPGC